MYFAYFQRRVGAAPPPQPRLELGGARRGPSPPDEDDDGWGWIEFGLAQMEGALDGIANGVKKMQEGAEEIGEGVQFLKNGIHWERKGSNKLRKFYY